MYTCYSTAEEEASVTSTATFSASVSAATTVPGAAEVIAGTTAVSRNISDNNDSIDSFKEIVRAKVKVRTTPGPVSAFTVRATTIIAVIVWEVMPNRTGGYAVRDFTTELRKLPQTEEEDKNTPWERMDPHHISPNAVSILIKSSVSVRFFCCFRMSFLIGLYIICIPCRECWRFII